MNCPRRIAVLDWLGGRLVHAVAGKRGHYQDLGQRFPHLAGCSPSELLQVARRELGIDQVYLADLDLLLAEPKRPLEQAAGGGVPTGADGVQKLVGSASLCAEPTAAVDGGRSELDWNASVAEWLADGWTVWSDRGRAGLWPRPSESLVAIESHPCYRPILGTESFTSPVELLNGLRSQAEPARWTVSLDLVGTERLAWYGHGAQVLESAAGDAWGRGRDAAVYEASVAVEGHPAAGWCGNLAEASWEGVGLEALVSELVMCGVRRIVVLNLSDVGTGLHRSGRLLSRLRGAFSAVEWISGGGVKDWDTVRQLGRWGADHVLVGTWLWEQLGTMGLSPLYRPIQTC